MVQSNRAELYDETYYRTSCGTPYERTPHWIQFFGAIADRIVRSIEPATVLDAGCAMGFLVEALRDRGVEAHGFDLSPYAISHVRDDIKPYCWVGSLTDPLPRRYDLIVCIEVLEHLHEEEAAKAVENLCCASDDILISSTPDDFAEATHFNVQPPEYWAGMFAEHGFLHDVEYDASFVTAWAMRFRRHREPLHRAIVPFERRLWLLSRQVNAGPERVVETRNAVAYQERIDDLSRQLAHRNEAITTLNAQLASKDETIAGFN